MWQSRRLLLGHSFTSANMVRKPPPPQVDSARKILFICTVKKGKSNRNLQLLKEECGLEYGTNSVRLALWKFGNINIPRYVMELR